MAGFEYLKKRRSEIDHTVTVGHRVENERDAVRLSERQRSIHAYVVGVSGTGKSRFLENLILQDVRKGHPLCLIDPMGDLYHRVLEYVADGIERACDSGSYVDNILPEYLFLDTKSDTAVCINPLEANDVETAEHQVDDLMQAVERLLSGSLEEKVRLRNILRGAFRVTAELNRLPRAAQPSLPAKCRQSNAYPLNLFFAVDFLNMTGQERSDLMNALPETETLRFRRQYAEFFAANPASEQSRLIQSSMNVFQYLLDDDMVLRVVNTNRSTVYFHELLRSGQSLFCHLPIGENLSGMSFLGRFITTKLQRAAYRRPIDQWSNSYYLYLDEFHHFCDQTLADAMTNLRKFGLRLINAHQSQSQPPFDTPEGQAMLETVKANSRIRVAFRLHRTDAEVMATELFALSQKRLSHTVTDVSTSIAKTQTRSASFGFSKTEGTSQSWSRSKSKSLGETRNFGIGRTQGTNIGQTLSKSQGGSLARGLSEGISESESTGVTEAFSRSHQISVAIGENWSQVRDHRRGFTFTKGVSESLAQLEGRDHSQTHSRQEGASDSASRSSQQTLSSGTQRGSSDQDSQSQGTQFMLSDDGGVTFYDPGRQQSGPGRTSRAESNSSGHSRSLAHMKSTATAQGESHTQAISCLKSVASGLTDKQASTSTSGSKFDVGESESTGLSRSEGGSHTDTIGDTTGQSLGRTAERGTATTKTASETETENWQDSLAEAFSVLDQFSQTYSEALQRSRSTSETVGMSCERSSSQSVQLGGAGSVMVSGSRTDREVYHSFEGERELYINSLQRLPERQCFVMGEPLQPTLLKTPFVPDHHYQLLTHNFPRTLLRLQAARLLKSQPEVQEVPPGAAPSKPVSLPAPPVQEPQVDLLEFLASEEESAVKEEGENDPFPD